MSCIRLRAEEVKICVGGGRGGASASLGDRRRQCVAFSLFSATLLLHYAHVVTCLPNSLHFSFSARKIRRLFNFGRPRFITKLFARIDLIRQVIIYKTKWCVSVLVFYVVRSTYDFCSTSSKILEGSCGSALGYLSPMLIVSSLALSVKGWRRSLQTSGKTPPPKKRRNTFAIIASLVNCIVDVTFSLGCEQGRTVRTETLCIARAWR